MSANERAIEATAEVVGRPVALPLVPRAYGYAKTRERVPIAGAEWERIPGESDPSWEGFTLYKAMDPRERSLAAVARTQGKHINTVANLAKKYFWAARAKAWDIYVANNADAAAQETLVQEARAIREQQLTVVKQQLAAAKGLKAQVLRGIKLQQDKQEPDARVLDYLARALERVVSMERLATGLPTDVTQQTISLKQQLDQTLKLVDDVKKIIAEELCGECRDRVARRIERVSAQQRAVRARLD